MVLVEVRQIQDTLFYHQLSPATRVVCCVYLGDEASLQ